MGSSQRCDVTQSYKFEEGSALERAALGAEAVDRPTDVEVDVKFSEQAAIGENFDIVVMVSDLETQGLVPDSLPLQTITREILWTSKGERGWE